jgi:hypothetical protein
MEEVDVSQRFILLKRESYHYPATYPHMKPGMLPFNPL